MSFDLHLLPLNPDDDFDAAMSLLKRLWKGDIPLERSDIDVRDASRVLEQLDPRYKPFRMNYERIAESMKISVAEAKAKYNWVEMNAPPDDNAAQFIFYRSHVDVHWYSGTSEDEMARYLAAICCHCNLTLVEPQTGVIHRLTSDGEFE